MLEKNYYLNQYEINTTKLLIHAKMLLKLKGATFEEVGTKLTKWNIYNRSKDTIPLEFSYISKSDWKGSVNYLSFTLNKKYYYFEFNDNVFFDPYYIKKPEWDIIDEYGRKRSYQRYMSKTNILDMCRTFEPLNDDTITEGAALLVNWLINDAPDSKIVTKRVRKYYNNKSYYYINCPVMK